MLNLFYQETLCTPAGNECYKSMSLSPKNCLSPCKGFYADVEKDVDIKNVEDLRKFDKIIENYEHYKRGFEQDIVYPSQLSSKFL